MFEIYNNENIVIEIDSHYIVEDYINFLLKIKSYNFYGEHNFCVNLNDLKNIIVQLNSLYNSIGKEIKIADYDSESFICFKFNNDKAVSIYGQLGAEWEDNLWVFKQEVDQTIIQILISSLSELINN